MAADRARLRELLKAKGLKMTNQRLRILETLEESEGQHLTVEELHTRVNTYLPEIGLATVYRTIQLFLEMGLADRIDLNDGQVRYEIADAGGDRRHHRHHHLICVKCGRVWAFEGDLLEELESRLLTELSFQVINHEVRLLSGVSEYIKIVSGGVIFFEKYKQFKIENHSAGRTGADRNEYYCL